MRCVIISFVILLALNINIVGKVKITVQSGSHDRIDCVVSADIASLNLNAKSSVDLYEMVGKQKKQVPCQIIMESNNKVLLYWILDGTTKANTVRTFIAEKVKKKQEGKPLMAVEDTQKALVLKKEGKNILQ